MRCNLLVAFILLLPGVLFSEIHEWPVETVFVADYGNEYYEYGFEKVMEHEDTSPVESFYIDSEFIYVSDRFQNNVKIYDYSGKFIRAVQLKGTRGKVPGSEMLVHENVIFMLREGGGVPPEGESNVCIYLFDLDTGNKLTELKLYNPEISRSKNGNNYVGGATSLNIGPAKGVWIYDAVHDKSYPLIIDGEIAQKEDHAIGIDGEIFEAGIIDYNEKNGNRELYNNSDDFIGIINSEEKYSQIGIDIRSHSKDGKVYLGTAGNGSPAIISWDGNIIGKRAIISPSTWPTYSSSTSYKFDPQGRFYRIFAENRGIVLYRWFADTKN